jgi:hypothetical protein
MLSKLSLWTFVLAAVMAAVSAVGIPRAVDLDKEDIILERGEHVYTLKDTIGTLQGSRIVSVQTDGHLSKGQHSSLRLYEDGKPLGPPFAKRQQMVEEGRGYYWHRPHRLSFTTSDNSDPRTNGRTYRASYDLGFSWGLIWLLLLITVVLRVAVVLGGGGGRFAHTSAEGDPVSTDEKENAAHKTH